MKRYAVSVVINVLVPGTGLILLGRQWLGLALAVWFALSSEAALFGWLIAPAIIPGWAIAGCGALGAAAWLIAQGLLVSRIRFLRDPNLAKELALLRKLAEEAMARGDYRAAGSALQLALSADDADLLSRVLWARLLSLRGLRSQARRAWTHVQRLDVGRTFADEARAVLECDSEMTDISVR